MTKSKLTNSISGFWSPSRFSFILLHTMLLFFCSPGLYAQLSGKAKQDSLLLELPKAQEDSNKLKLLRKISNSYRRDNHDEALRYGKECVKLAEKLKIKKLIAASNYHLGNLYLEQSAFSDALDCFYTALKLEQTGDDKESTAAVLHNIALVYQNLGDHAKAIDFYLKALKLFEEAKNTRGMANSHLNISSIYTSIDADDKARSYLQTALKLYTAMSDKHGIALSLNNLGTLDTKTMKFSAAKEAFTKALAIYEDIQDFEGIDLALINLAEIYDDSHDFTRALEYGFKALAVSSSHELPEAVAYDYKTISEIYYNMVTKKRGEQAVQLPPAGKSIVLKKAGAYVDSSIAIYKEIGMLQEYAQATELSAKINFASGRYKEAYEGYTLFKALNDSVFNIEKDKKITQSAMQYDFDKKEAAIKAEQEKKNIRQRNIRNSIMVGLVGCLVFLVVVYRQRNRIAKEKARSEELLLNILPEEVADELKEKGSADAKHFAEVTVMFTDFKGFTQISEKLTPAELVAEIHTCFKAFDQIITKYDIEKIKTIGDAYMCAGGLPVTNTTNAIDVVRAALEIQQFMQQHLVQRKLEGKEPFEIRIGIHTGPVVAGIVGVKKFAYDIWGDTVNTASRMESSGEAGKVNISGSTYAIVKDTFNCTYRGKVNAKGKGEVDMYFVEGVKVIVEEG